MELKSLVRDGGFIDGFLIENNKRIGYSWRRRGRKQSRLDRVYVPREKVDELLCQVDHYSHLSDHDCLIVKLKGCISIKRRPKHDSYWKLNKAVLIDPEFSLKLQRVPV